MADDIDRTELRERMAEAFGDPSAYVQREAGESVDAWCVRAAWSVVGPELERLQDRIARALYELRRGGQTDGDRRRAADRILNEGDDRG